MNKTYCQDLPDTVRSGQGDDMRGDVGGERSDSLEGGVKMRGKRAASKARTSEATVRKAASQWESTKWSAERIRRNKYNG